MFALGNDFNYPCHHGVEKCKKIQIHFYVFWYTLKKLSECQYVWRASYSNKSAYFHHLLGSLTNINRYHFQREYVITSTTNNRIKLLSIPKRQRLSFHDDFMKWKHFPRYWPFVMGIHRSPVDPPPPPPRPPHTHTHTVQRRGALMFSEFTGDRRHKFWSILVQVIACRLFSVKTSPRPILTYWQLDY